MRPFVEIDLHIAVAQLALDIAPSALSAGIPAYLNLVPGNAYVAQADEEFALDTHDRRQAAAVSGNGRVHQRFERERLHVGNRRGIVPCGPCAGSCHVDGCGDHAFRFLREHQNHGQRLRACGGFLLGEGRRAGADGSFGQILVREFQFAIRKATVCEPGSCRFGERHVESDVGRYGNFERRARCLQVVGQLLHADLRLGHLLDFQNIFTALGTGDLHRCLARVKPVVLRQVEIHDDFGLGRTLNRHAFGQPALLGRGDLGSQIAVGNVRVERHGDFFLLRVGELQLLLADDLQGVDDAALHRDPERYVLAAHLEDVVGDLVLLGLVGIDREGHLGAVAATGGRRVHEGMGAFERPFVRTGYQHRDVAALAGQNVRFGHEGDFELLLGLRGSLLEGDRIGSRRLAAGERIAEGLVLLLVVGFHRELHDVAVLAFQGGRGYVVVCVARERPFARAGDHYRCLAALAADVGRFRSDGDFVRSRSRLFVVFIVAGAAAYERGCSEKEPFSYFHSVCQFVFVGKKRRHASACVFHAAAVN